MNHPRRNRWLVHLKAMMRGYEADCLCRKVKPEDLTENHTWLAIAYIDAKTAIAKAEPGTFENPTPYSPAAFAKSFKRRKAEGRT